jgi:multiple sugar transport system permease protein
MAADRTFRRSLTNTLIYVGLVAPASVALGLLVALLIEGGTRGRATFRAIFFLPVVSLTVAMASAWQYLLHPTIGPVNAALRALGLGTPFWLSSSDTVLVTLAAIGVWENAGFNMVLFLAGSPPSRAKPTSRRDGRRALRAGPLPPRHLAALGPTTLFVVTITLIRSSASSTRWRC